MLRFPQNQSTGSRMARLQSEYDMRAAPSGMNRGGLPYGGSQQQGGMGWDDRPGMSHPGGYQSSFMDQQSSYEMERARAAAIAVKREAEHRAREEAYYRRQRAEQLYREREMAPPRFTGPSRPMSSMRREVAMGRPSERSRYRQPTKGKLASRPKAPVVKAKMKGKLKAKKPLPVKKLLPNKKKSQPTKPKPSLDSALSASREPKSKTQKLDEALSSWRGAGGQMNAPPDIGEIDVLPKAGENGGWPEVYAERWFKAKYGLTKFGATALAMVEEQLDLGKCSFLFPKAANEGDFECHICYGSGNSMRSYASGTGDSKVTARSKAVNNLLVKTLEGYDGDEEQLENIWKEEARATKEKTTKKKKDLNEILESSKLKYTSNDDWGGLVNTFAQALNSDQRVQRRLSEDGQECICNCELTLTEENQSRFGLPEVITVEVQDGSARHAKLQSIFTICKLLFPNCKTYKDVKEKINAMKAEKNKRKEAEGRDGDSKKPKRAKKDGAESDENVPEEDAEAKEDEDDNASEEDAEAKEDEDMDKDQEDEKDDAEDEEEEASPEDGTPQTPEPETPEAPKIDFRSLTVAKLKAECKSRELPTAGVKAMLIQRLEEALAEEEAEAAARKAARKASKEMTEDEGKEEYESKFASVLRDVFEEEESSEEINIRLCNGEDANEVATLFTASFGADENLAEHITVDSLLQDMLGCPEPLGYVAIAEKDGDSLGYAMFSFDFMLAYGKVLRLKSLFIKGETPDAAIQSKLLTKIASLVDKAGCAALLWDNTTDEKLFEAFGLDAQGEKLESSTFAIDSDSISQFLEQNANEM